MNYYVIKNLDTDEVLFVIANEAALFGGRRLHPEQITKAQYETYIEFEIPTRDEYHEYHIRHQHVLLGERRNGNG